MSQERIQGRDMLQAVQQATVAHVAARVFDKTVDAFFAERRNVSPYEGIVRYRKVVLDNGRREAQRSAQIEIIDYRTRRSQEQIDEKAKPAFVDAGKGYRKKGEE
jgi:hypothetical protein